MKDVKAKYTDWGNNNTQLPSTPPEVAGLTVELERVEAQLRQLGYM
jgi:hypothetical protein